jgi:hypothetical protein
MKSTIRSLALVGLVAMCLIVAPAFSAPTENSASKAQCNASGKYNCNAFEPGTNGMWYAGMDGMGHHGKYMGGMGPMCMMDWKSKSCKNESWNETRSIEIGKAGSGFAMSGNQNHVLKMNLESKIKPDLAGIKKLISDNKTLGQIKSDIKAKINAEISAASYNGSLHLGQSNYNLVNIKLTTLNDNSSTIEADVAGPKLNFKDKPTTSVGHITITTSRQENSTIGEGTLNMNGGQYSGQYKVLLEMRHTGNGMGMGELNCMNGCSFTGMKEKGEKFGMNKEMRMPKDNASQKA